MAGKIRESATLKRIEKKRRAKRLRLARNIALGLTGIFSLASMKSGEGLLWGSSAEAAEVSISTSTTTSDSDATTTYKLTNPGVQFTLESGGKAQCIYSYENGIVINLNSGATVGGGVSNAMYGGPQSSVVNIYGTVTKGLVRGGTANGDGLIMGNYVNIFPGASVPSFIYGGESGNAATVKENFVTITGGTIGGDSKEIYGGYSENGIATSNKVEISGDTTSITGNVFGGGSRLGSVGGASADDGNNVTVSRGTINGSVYGGFSHKWDLSSTGDVTYNTVNISGTSTNISGTSTNIGENIYGGYSDSGAASNNKVTITGGAVGVDDTKEVVGGLSATGEASNNTVDISGGTIKGYIRGGVGDKANNNTVTISKDANIVGGTARIYGAIGFSEANNNTVKIQKEIDVLHIMGAEGPGTGNTLEISAKGVTVGSEGVYGFQNYNFILPTNVSPGESMLTISPGNEYAYTDLTGTTTTVSFADTSYAYTKGNYNLIEGGIKEGTSPDTINLTAITNIDTFKDSTVAINGKNLVLTLAGSVIGDVRDYAIGNEVDNTTQPPQTTGDVTGSSLELTSVSTVNKAAYGGGAKKGDVTNSSLLINGGTVQGYAYGGYTGKGTVGGTGEGAANSVTVKSGEIGSVYGGYTADGEATNNAVTVAGGKIKGGTNVTDSVSFKVIGGQLVEIHNLTRRYHGAIGGYSNTNGNVTNSIVTVTDGTVGEKATVTVGGWAASGTAGGSAAAGNTATVTDGTVNGLVAGGVGGGIISGEVTKGDVKPASWSVSSGSATYNTVKLSGGTVTGGIVGGAAYGTSNSASNNTVSISEGASISADTVGGEFIPAAIFGGAAINGAAATGNTVEISGGTVSGGIAGGAANKAGSATVPVGSYSATLDLATSTASANAVTISGTPTLTSASIYGSAMYDIANGALTTDGAGGGNTLNLSTQGVTAKNIYNFQTVNVDLSLLSDKPMLTLTGGQTDLGGAAFATTETLSKEENIGPQGITGTVLANENGFIWTGGITTDWKAHDKYDYGFTKGEGDKSIDATIYQREGNTPEVAAGTTVTGNVYGGRAMSAGKDATGNTLTINGTVAKDADGNATVYGGYSETGAATGNTVELSGGSVAGDVYGGYAKDTTKATSGNTVTLAGTDVSASTIYGGNGADATGNTLNVNAAATVKNIKNFATIQFNKLPASATDAVLTLTEGDVDLSESNVVAEPKGSETIGAQGATGTLISATGGTITGGTSDWTAAGENGKYEYANTLNGDRNKLNVEVFQTKDHTAEVKEAVEGDVFGGKAQTTGNDATGNALTVSAAVTAEDGKEANAYGGFSKQGSATGNALNVAANVANSVYAGYAEGTGNAGAEGKGNTLTITGGTMEAAYGGYAKNGNADYNTVNMTGGTITGTGGDEPRSLFGGKSENGSADNNQVNFSGESVDEIFGGYTESGQSASNNTVSVTGGTFTGGRYGIVGGYAGQSGTASGNTIDITGGEGTVNLIYGGYGAATGNNTVNLGANTSIDDTYSDKDVTDGKKALALLTNARICGGSASAAGNTLNVYAMNTAAVNIENFENINFFIPEGFKASTEKDAKASGDTMLTLTDTKGTDVSNAAIGAALTVEGTSDYRLDDVLFLMTNDNGITAKGTTYADMTDDALNTYGLEIMPHKNGNSIIAKVVESGLDESAKSLTETRTAAADFLNMGGDMLAGSGIGGAVAAANAARLESDRKGATASGADGLAADEHDETEKPKSGHFTPFASIGGANQRAKTGSHVDVRGWNLDLGCARAIENEKGVLTFGPFVEYGSGNYTSVLDNGTKGFGDTHYMGVGFFVRQDLKSGLWLEGSLRGGRTSNDYRGNVAGKDVTYDTDNNYYGVHIGVGKRSRLKDDAELDVYGRLFWTNQAAAHTDASVNGVKTHYDFDSVNSTRLRIGTRYTKHTAGSGSLYAGLAFEYEFNGDADGTRVTAARRDATGSPTLKGASGMLELGWLMKPTDRSPMTLDLGLTGWAGRRRGLGAHVSMNWSL